VSCMRDHCHRSAQLLRRLLEAGRIPREQRLSRVRAASCVNREGGVRRVPGTAASHRTLPGRGRLCDLSSGLAIRLKYGRKVAVARTMARYMAPLVKPDGEAPLLVPVPLHRTRLWARGFNQSALVASELSRRLGMPADPFVLRRTRRTSALKGMSSSQRRRAVVGAFRVRNKSRVEGRTVVLIDDVLTTGSTAEACARALMRAGAARVELVSWARVVRPSQLMR